MKHFVLHFSRRSDGWRTQGLPAIAALLLGLAAAPVSSQPVAVVVDRVGEVTLEASNPPRTVALLELVGSSARIRLSSSGRLVLLYMHTGNEYTAVGPSLIEVGPNQLQALAGNDPVLHVPPAGKELRLRPGRVALGGVVMRSMKTPEPTPAASVGAIAGSEASAATQAGGSSAPSSEIDARRPSAAASFADRVAFALWLDDVGASAEARSAWRALSEERPTEAALARKAK
jgi:hypothetical protein